MMTLIGFPDLFNFLVDKTVFKDLYFGNPSTISYFRQDKKI